MKFQGGVEVVDVTDELVVDAEVEAVEVAARTHGVAIKAATTAIAIIAVSCAVLVFILASMQREGATYILDFPDGS